MIKSEKKQETEQGLCEVFFSLPDNRALSVLYGKGDSHLTLIADFFQVRLAARGNKLFLKGKKEKVFKVRHILEELYQKVLQDGFLTLFEIEGRLRMSDEDEEAGKAAGRDQPEEALPEIKSPFRAGRHGREGITPKSKGQIAYIQALQKETLLFVTGPAGTGKTFLAVAEAVFMLQSGLVDRIILSRPAVEAGERLGFLPGDMREKVDPYLRPLYDALESLLSPEKLMRYLASGQIEAAPLAFMRGRTLSRAFIILDEAQNTAPVQMKMFLTRLGEGSRMVITGDVTQTDLPQGQESGLDQAMSVLKGVEGVKMIRLTGKDTVRHPLVSKIVTAYEAWEDARKAEKK